jgi:hypothetical protein
MSEYGMRTEHCCDCAKSEDGVSTVGVAAQIVTEGGASRDLNDEAEALLLAAFNRERRRIELEALPKL